MNTKIINLFETEINTKDAIRACECEIKKLERECKKLDEARLQIMYNTYRPSSYLDVVIKEKIAKIYTIESRIQELSKGQINGRHDKRLDGAKKNKES